MSKVQEKQALRNITEHDFSVAVREYAERHGWIVGYVQRTGYMGTTRDKATGETVRKWRGLSPAGEPDLRLARLGRYIAAELKTETGRTTPDQDKWLTALGCNGFLWRPRDAKAIMEVLG